VLNNPVEFVLLIHSAQLSFGDIQAQEDEPGILKSQRYFHSLIASEIEAGIPSNRIVLGGFSQGGAMSIFSGITSEKKLGGIFALSSYLLLHSKLQELTRNGANKETPIFMGQGDSDPLIRPEWARQTAKELENAGYKVSLKVYP
jgi:predicted esterase